MDPELGQLGATVGLVVAASMALQTAMGPAMANIVDAIKATGRTPENHSGVVCLAIGTTLGLLAGGLACAHAGSLELLWIGVGGFAGLVGLGSGGVRSNMVREGAQAIAAKEAPQAVQPAAQPATPPAPLAAVGSARDAAA